MPSYELVVLLHKLERPALKDALKRSAQYIFDFDGTIRRIENLGFRNLPYTFFHKGKVHRNAHFFIFSHDMNTDNIKPLREKIRLDVDVIKAHTFTIAKSPFELHAEKEKQECTLYEDLLPPPLRPAVIELQQAARKPRVYKYSNYNDPEFKIV